MQRMTDAVEIDPLRKWSVQRSSRDNVEFCDVRSNPGPTATLQRAAERLLDNAMANRTFPLHGFTPQESDRMQPAAEDGRR